MDKFSPHRDAVATVRDPCEKPTPLVLLPGTLCDTRVFAPLISALGAAEPRRRIQVLPVSGAASTAALAQAALRRAPPRFALLGFSLGGLVALEMAAAAPDRLAGLALVASNARPVALADRPARRAALQTARTLGARAYVEEALWPASVAPAAVSNAALRASVGDMAEDLGLGVLADQIEAAIGRADSRPRLGAIAAPTLLLCGADDATCTVAMHEEMAAGIAGASLVIVRDAGHFLLLERPAAAADAVLDWLVEVDAAEAFDLSEITRGSRSRP